MNKESNKYIKIVNRLIKWVTEVHFTSKNVFEKLWILIHAFVLRFPRYMQHFLQLHSGNWRICSTKILVNQNRYFLLQFHIATLLNLFCASLTWLWSPQSFEKEKIITVMILVTPGSSANEMTSRVILLETRG